MCLCVCVGVSLNVEVLIYRHGRDLLQAPLTGQNHLSQYLTPDQTSGDRSNLSK